MKLGLKQLLYLLWIFVLAACSPLSTTRDVEGKPSDQDIAPLASDVPAPGDDVHAGVLLSVTAPKDQMLAPGDVVILEITLDAREDVPQASLSFNLPPEAQLVDGNFTWQEDLFQGQKRQIQVPLEILDWPLSKPIKITLSNNISTFWDYWPEESDFNGVEPSPSVALSLQVEPPNPEPGEMTRFLVRMLPQADIIAVEGQLSLPAAFQLDPGSTLSWQGDLTLGVEQMLEVFAVPTEQPLGEARFDLDLKSGETVFVIHNFGEPAAPAAPLGPQGLPDDTTAEPPTFEDERPLAPDSEAPDSGAPASNLPLADITVLERGRTADEIDFTLFVHANQPLTNAQLSVLLPESLELIGGSLDWSGGLAADESIQLEFQVARRALQVDTLEVYFSSEQGDAQPFIYEIVPEDDRDEANGSAAEEPTGTLYLSGRFVYSEDGTTTRGIYYCHVDVYDDDGALNPDDFVCSDTTDGNGYWSCSGTASDGIFDSTVEIYARVRAYNSWYGSVQEMDNDEYRFKTSNHNMSEDGGTHNFGTWWPGTQGGNNQSGAFHIHKMAAYANATSEYAGGERPPKYDEAHFVTLRWPDTDGDNSSEYNNWNVYIEGPGSTDPDEWDESVILHEYGHYLMDHFAVLGSPNYCHDPGEISPNCSHSFNSHEDPTTAYLEGWPNYFQSAVKRYRGLANAHMYIETTWSFNIETSWHSTSSTWDDAESTTAGIMWDINDYDDDDQNSDGAGDTINLYHNENHAVFSNYPVLACGTPTTIHGFYTCFQDRYAYDSQVIKIFYEHGINKDFVSPTGSININSGATYATSTGVTLNLSASDSGTGVSQMRFANSGTIYSSWESYGTTKSWTLPSSNGTKTVYVQYRDVAGNTRTSSDSIVLDTVVPSNPNSIWSPSHTVGAWSSDTTIDASWSGASDATSGVYGYGLYWSKDSPGTPAPVVDTTGTSDTGTATSDGNWYFNLRTRDNAGNWSGSTNIGPFKIDTTPPSSSMDTLPAHVCSTSTLVSWSGTDPSPGSGVAEYDVQYRVGASGTWYYWLYHTASTSDVFPTWVFPGKTLYFRSRAIDAVGNSGAFPTGAQTSTIVDFCTFLPLTIK